MRLRHWLMLAAVLLLVIYLLPEGHLNPVTEKVRKGYLRRAQVWQQDDISRKNLLAGPQNDVSVRPEQEVTCRYLKTGAESGATPKFKCTLTSNGKTVRIKYHRRDTLGEIAGTRLLWALGFYTDEVYPVQLICLGCPTLYEEQTNTSGKLLLKDAILERNFPGIPIEVFKDEGWKWSELDYVDEKSGGASRAHIDALKLVAVLIKHNDSKHQQQRLACYEQDIQRRFTYESCRKPVLMIQDLGATFGVGGSEVINSSSLYLKGWDQSEVWNRQKETAYLREHPGKLVCFGNLTSSESDGLFDPQISEEGRSFLAGLLNQLSDQQILDLFTVARIEATGELIEDANGGMRPVTPADWAAAFKRKRQQINDHRCS